MMVSESEIKKLLKRFPHGVKISVEMPNGEKFTVNKKPLTKQDIINENYADLIDVPITVSDAVKKYNVPKGTLHTWISKKYLAVLSAGYRMTINEADVAYCAAIYKRKKETGIGFRGPLLDENGLPYQLKHPSLSLYRKKRKTGELPQLPRAK